MNPQEALQIFRQVQANYTAPGSDHIKILQAIHALELAIAPKTGSGNAGDAGTPAAPTVDAPTVR